MRKPRNSQGILAPFLPNLILIQDKNALSAVPVEVYLRVLATMARKKLLLPLEEALGSERATHPGLMKGRNHSQRGGTSARGDGTAVSLKCCKAALLS